MELVLFFIVLMLISVLSFWLVGLMYGVLLHRPAILFPLHLALKMAAGAVFGSLLLGFGGIILATVFFNHEMAKRQDYRRLSTIIAGLVMSIVCCALIYYLAFALAWEMLG